MPHRSEHTSTILLERPGDAPRSVPMVAAGSSRAPRHADDATLPGPSPRRSSVTQPALPSPGMALLAAISILEGYKWIGAIPTSDSRLSVLVFGRAGAVVFAGVAAVTVLALTRVDRGGRRPRPQKLILLATVAVMASSIVLLWTGGTVGRHACGVADLALASSLAGAIVVGQWRQRAARQGRTPTRPGGSGNTPCR